MSQAKAESVAKAWLLSRSGSHAGTRFPMSDGVTRIGRAPANDIVLEGPEAATVSLQHVEIERVGNACFLRDLESTNGTFLNGERVTNAEISPPGIIQFGNQGPEFALVWEDATTAILDRTIEIPLPADGRTSAAAAAPAPEATHENLLVSAVARARRIRAHGMHGQTMTIMRGVLEQALARSRRRFRIIGYSLAAALVLVTSVGIWKITAMKRDKRAIDAQIHQLETQLQNAKGADEAGQLISRLDDYQGQAQSLERSLLYRLGSPAEDGDFVTRDLRAVMAEFGAEVYSIPPDFLERVNHYIQQDQGPNRPLIAHALTEAGPQIQTIRGILREEQLPPDLAYIPLVESALADGPGSAAGAVGPWQFTAPTARALGLRVDGQIDERKDLVKSTRASCKYLRDLILDFGAGSSVMLALAAYNSGTSKVKQAVVKNVRDPIQQRNFWYLYRMQALPKETREYVPKVFAAILIGRNPRRFGF